MSATGLSLAAMTLAGALAGATMCMLIVSRAVRRWAARASAPAALARGAAVALPFAVQPGPHPWPPRIVWAPADGLPEPAHADAIAALALAHRAEIVVVASMRPAAQEAARIFLEVAWARLRVGRACPRVVQDAPAAVPALARQARPRECDCAAAVVVRR